MNEILMNDLINNIKGYKLLYNEEKDNLVNLDDDDDETIEDVVISLIYDEEEKTVIFIIDKNGEFITCFVDEGEDEGIVSYTNKRAYKTDILDNLNEYVTNTLEVYNPVCVGIFQETEDNKYKSLELIEDFTEEELKNAFLSKEIRCRYCHKLMDKETGLSCKTGDGYREQDWYVKFKNGHIMNLWDYIDMNVNPKEMSNYQSIKIINYELQDR